MIARAEPAVHSTADVAVEVPPVREILPAADNDRRLAPPIVRSVLATSGEPLDPAMRAFAEPRFRADFGRVRIHRGSDASRAAALLESNAFTVGSHVVFGADQYRPATRRGRWLIGHELAHTLQQGSAAAPQRLAWDQGEGDHMSASAEAVADGAANALLEGRPVPAVSTVPAGPTVRRQHVKSVETVSDDVKIATLDNDTRIRVKRVRWLAPKTEKVGWAKLEPGIDRQRLWLELEWCAGQNHGTIKAGANIPQQVLQTIVKDVTSGGDLDAAVKNIDVTPFVETDILQSGSFHVTAGGTVTLDMQGKVTGWSGKVGVSKGPFDVDVNVGPANVPGHQGGVQGGVTVTVTPGRTDPSHECRKDKHTVVENTRFECETLQKRPDIVKTETKPVTDRRSRYVYFNYANATVAPRSSGIRGEIAADLKEGFRVDSIQGFTSPEGPMPKGPGFMGNRELARRRAKAAADVVEDACKAAAIGPRGSCLVGGEGGVTPTGEGELYTLTALDASGKTVEIEGDPLAQHATEEFLKAEAEEPHRTPELVGELTAPGVSPQEQADRVYPLLRRAAIGMTRTQTKPVTTTTPQEPEWTGTTCPDDVVEAVFPKAVGGLGQ